MIRRQLIRTSTAVVATAATFLGLTYVSATAAAPMLPPSADVPDRRAPQTAPDAHDDTNPRPPHERPVQAHVRPPESPARPESPAAPADPAESADGPAGDDGDDDAKKGGKAPESHAATARPRRETKKADATRQAREKAAHDRANFGLVPKDRVADVAGNIVAGGDDMVEAVPDWVWPFRAYLGSVAAPGTGVELAVTATDAVTVTAKVTAADGPSEGTPLEVAVTVTPAAPDAPSGPATVAVEVTDTTTGESATPERTTTPEAVTVVATVTTVHGR